MHPHCASVWCMHACGCANRWMYMSMVCACQWVCTHLGGCHWRAYTSVCPCLHECAPIHAFAPNPAELCLLIAHCSCLIGGETPEPKQYFFGIVHFKHANSRYPKTPFLVHGVQWYGWLGRHPRTQTIFQTPFQQCHCSTCLCAFSLSRRAWGWVRNV